ncbi:hypothetical protein ACE6ED_26540 [Paenibacillus sp. CN-4]
MMGKMPSPITATIDDSTIKLTHNSYDVYLNGKKVELNQAPSLSRGDDLDCCQLFVTGFFLGLFS